MYWNFYDSMGECHWTEEFIEGDTLEGILSWWHNCMEEEGYTPEIREVLLEDFNGARR